MSLRIGKPTPWLSWSAFVAAALANAVLLWWFHDRYWYPVDEGNYAHIAERVLAGEVLHLQIQDLHPGYVNVLNALAFWWFGLDLVSLRYPLAFVSFAQACLVFALIVRRDILLATIGSVAVIGLGVIQFLNPTAHWYCLGVSTILVCWLAWMPPSNLRTYGAGFLVGVITLFRQLTGVWVAMAVVVLLLLEYSASERKGRSLLGRAVVVLMLLTLVGYLFLAGGPTPGGMLLIGSWPVVIFAFALTKLTIPNRAATALLGRLGIGAAVAAVPLVSYHVVNGSLYPWLEDVVVASVGLTQLEFFNGGWFTVLSIAGLHQAVSSASAVQIVNGLYWAVLPVLPAINGGLLLRAVRQRREASDFALPVIAAFYALVSLHLEGPVYLYYGLGLPIAAVLWMAATQGQLQRLMWAAASVPIIFIAVLFHAGQSSSRTSRQVLEGHRTFTSAAALCPPFHRSRLKVEAADCERYHQLVSVIERETAPHEHIFAVPSDAQLYFLSDRPNPFRFYNTALGIRTDADLAAVVGTLAERPPRLITYRPSDKYNTEASHRIMEYVRSTYDRLDTVGDFEVYRSRTSPTTTRLEATW